jgi:hypothetical protein
MKVKDKWSILMAPLASDDQLLRTIMFAVGKASESGVSSERLKRQLDIAWDALEEVQKLQLDTTNQKVRKPS